MSSTSLALCRPTTKEKDAPKKRVHSWSYSSVVLFVGDCTVVAFCMSIAFYIRYILNIGIVESGQGLELIAYFPHYLAGFGLFILLAQDKALYDANVFPFLEKTTSRFIKISLFWAVMFLGSSLILKLNPPISRLFVGYTCVLMCVMLPLWRFTHLRITRRLFLEKALTRHVLIIGAPSMDNRLSENLTANRSDLYKIVGLVTPYRNSKRYRTEVPLLGCLEDIEGVLSMYDIDVCVVDDKELSQPEVLKIARVCEKKFIEFNLVPTHFEVFTLCLGLKMIGAQPVLGIAELPQNHAFSRVLKRLVDIVGALVGLLVTLPLVPIIAYLINRESPGPIIYKQIRTGLRGKTFTIYKFRSMKLSSEADGKARWCQENDPRRLKIGSFLRKWNIDELPQFWNVLKGDMSLVGPRPERPELIVDFLKEIPHYQSRHSVRPGMTGWAQVNGLRGDTSLNERVRHDLHYIENWSLWLDLVIKFRTLFQYKNAY